MKHDERNVPQIVRLLLSSVTAVLLASLTCVTAPAQEKSKPITKEVLLRSLKPEKNKEKMSAEEYVEAIGEKSVDFCMTDKDEQEIRQAGAYLGKAGLDSLIAAVRDSYGCLRVRVSLFRYAPCEPHFEQFAAVISSKIIALPSRFTSKGAQYAYVKRLYLAKEEKPFDMSRADAERYWKETRSLQLLQGMCWPKGGDVYVHSQVFLGDLSGSLVTPFPIEFKVSPEEFSQTKDIHSVLILYALAQEAHAKGLNTNVVADYLSEALKIVTQIRQDNPSILQPVESAIRKKFSDLGVSPHVLSTP